MSATGHRSGPWATTLHERKGALRLHSETMRQRLADECREGWQAASEPLDRVWIWRSRLLRLWQTGQTITAHRPWLLLAVPLAWRLLRRTLRRHRPDPATAAAAAAAAQAATSSTSSRAVHWAGRLSAWWSAWRVLRPVVRAWLDDSDRRR
jgi:hypothetical protein